MVSENIDKENFVVCEKCGKRLIGRLSNGLWHFRFGRNSEDEKDISSPVDIYIYGSIKIQCIRRSCKHWNILNYFPTKVEVGKE